MLEPLSSAPYEQKARELRALLHTLPEPSMHETKTKNTLIAFLKEETTLSVTDRGSWFYAYRQGTENAETVAFRADFDAVTGEDGISRHLCGHDGHAACLAAFGKWISDVPPEKNVFLLFQPGEESGEGAAVCSALLKTEHIDRIFGFHNIPGAPVGQILLRHGTFACASVGLQIRFTGSPAHAAYPEYGVNPAEAIASLILAVSETLREPHRGIVLSTVIGIDAGSDKFGVSASEGVLRLTVRAEHSDEFASLLAFIRQNAAALAAKHGLAVSISETDAFPATENDDACLSMVSEAAARAGLDTASPAVPFRWSEDFGRYLQIIPGAFFGVGSGEACPALHTADYRFPDAVIPYVLRLYRALC